jgi:hypothetical protein
MVHISAIANVALATTVGGTPNGSLRQPSKWQDRPVKRKWREMVWWRRKLEAKSQFSS